MIKVLKTVFLFLVILAIVSCSEANFYLPVTFTDNRFILKEEEHIEKKPLFFKLEYEGRDITFFVIKINGKMESYFNICNSCRRVSKGYMELDNFVACKVCNVKIPYESLHMGLGNCYPYRLEGSGTDNLYVITKESILKGLQYF